MFKKTTLWIVWKRSVYFYAEKFLHAGVRLLWFFNIAISKLYLCVISKSFATKIYCEDYFFICNYFKQIKYAYIFFLFRSRFHLLSLLVNQISSLKLKKSTLMMENAKTGEKNYKTKAHCHIPKDSCNENQVAYFILIFYSRN